MALARTLADAGDTLAFGALMRGPFVGLAEEELLDVTAALPALPERPESIPRFSLLTDPVNVIHPVACQTLSTLQDLRRRSRATTPMLLLAEAMERLAVRPILAAREKDRSARAAANVETFLERARNYGVKGLKRFVRDMMKEWEASTPRPEGRIDAEGDAIAIVTMHSSKGLEWPVVIPINTATLLRSREQFVYRASDDTLHWVLGDVVPPDLDMALQLDEESLTRERERLWYVACTRAKELLVVPEISAAAQNSWARIVDLAHQDLPELDVSGFSYAPFQWVADPPNSQTADLFERERSAISKAAIPLTWLRPSDRDPDRMPLAEIVVDESSDAPEPEVPVVVGRIRGLILHKLMEEVLTGELAENLTALAMRARELMNELPLEPTDKHVFPGADEIAATTLKTLHLPEIATLRPGLVPEFPLYAMLSTDPDHTALAGRADAVAFNNSQPAIVVDWKSDVAPTTQDVRIDAEQLHDYMVAIGAPRGALVYMTSGTVRWVEAPGSPA
jgi:CRISPR-associated exonuclease Cas4